MKISSTLSGYLARTYLLNFTLFLLAMLAMIYLFDAIELGRRASKVSGHASLGLILEMALLQLPKEGQTLLPFAVLYSGMFTFWQMTRRYELIVVRATGFSFWQFLAPIMGVAIVAGILHMTVINPVSSVMVSKYEQMERKYFQRGDNAEIALFKEGLWLRQAMSDGGYVIIYSPKLSRHGWTLQTPMAVFFSKDNEFVRRVDAKEARLDRDHWTFENATLQDPKSPILKDEYLIPTSLTRADVEDSFTSPTAMSFWRLPSHIQTLDDTGFDSSRLRVYYQSLLAQPLLFAAMILLAATVSLRPPRVTSGALALVVSGVFMGFVIFFLSSFLQALGSSQQIPVMLSAWAPPLVSFMLGLSAMMSLEDG